MNTERSPLPTRIPADRAMAATLRLWRASECTDPSVLRRVAIGLQALPATCHADMTTNGPTPDSARIGARTGLGHDPHPNTPTGQRDR